MRTHAGTCCKILYNRCVLQKLRYLTTWIGLALAGVGCSVQPLTPVSEATATTLPPVRVVSVTFSPTPALPLRAPTITVPPASQVALPTPTPEVAVETRTMAEVAPVSVAGVSAETLPTETAGPPVVVVPPPSEDVAAAEQYCIDWINSERAAAGVALLVRDETLMGIARARVADMIARGYTGHDDPVTGEALGQVMMRAAGYTSNYLGENWYGTINAPPTIVEVAMTWFMSDPPHARNILSPNYSGVGVGIGFNGQQWLLVQNFAGY